MKIADEISYEISYRSYMSEIRITNSYNIFMQVLCDKLTHQKYTQYTK